ncbi:FAD-binding oxidoreductase [Haliangium sp.]|uniref:FAD-binding oxidoreductase n=1 Tax=Haliangium sp. TaxID=2663208 RepID=UPI003D09EE24
MSAADASERRDLRRELAAIVGDEHLQPVDVDARTDARTDAGASARAWPAWPAWIVAPSSAAEVAELVALANRRRIAVVPVGSGTRGPVRPDLAERTSLLVRTERMNHVLRLDETSLVAHVQAGVTAMGLERVLAPRRLSLGDYPPAAMRSSIGGLLAVRTPGKSSPRHGFIEDAVLGISAVLADGRAIHTRMAPRRATGPDLARALCGSEGTLGFITSVYLRIHRRPEARFLAAHVLPDIDAALAAVHLALREEAAPAALRVYDSAEAREHLGMEVARDPQAVLTVATAGPTDLAACDRDLLASAAEVMGGHSLDEQVAQRWWQRRQGREPGTAPAPPAMQVTASPATQKAVYHAVCDAARAHGAEARGYVSRFDYDGAVLFFTFSEVAASADAPGSVLAGEALAAVRAPCERAAQAAGALLLGTQSPTMSGYLSELRAILDPTGIMNPGALQGPATADDD